MSKTTRNESSRSRNSKEKQLEEYLKAIFDNQQVSMLDLVTKKDLVIFGFQQNQILEEKWLRTDDKVQALDDKVQALDDKVQVLAGKLVELSSEMKELKTRMQHLEADMQGIRSDMANLETTVTKQVQKLKDIWWKTVGLLTTIIIIVITILRYFP